ncbi:hypothetical protein MGG_16956 [Pyricularia oryzae 70-15]|uniref:Uncharacterized protein n=1 Tax=Pyricularia oryzae (strain 70-15 / ATCC MYA-4617 / FGSC 8958) TaxID=242507 RepID=G4N204_PYRO7|nr:uncharacterized protein MGG_16956 [Pyricularia oryzae 70-15]EHA53314.1 hypothetical protein MGG_16956 [Pyricularia oryzae 70-15]
MTGGEVMIVLKQRRPRRLVDRNLCAVADDNTIVQGLDCLILGKALSVPDC